MAFIWRRRSTSIVKIIAILTAIWFFVAFFIYTDDTRRENGSNKWNAMSQHLKSLAGAGPNNNNNQLDNFEREGVFEAGGGFGVGNNVVLERNNNAGGNRGNDLGEQAGEDMAADIPIAQPDEPNNDAGGGGYEGDAEDADENNDINEADESILNNVVVHPNEKVHHGKLVAGKRGNSKEKQDDGE